MEQWQLQSALNREAVDAPDVEQQWQLISERLELDDYIREDKYKRPFVARVVPVLKWVAGIAAMVMLVVGLRMWVDRSADTDAVAGQSFDILAKSGITEVTLTTADGKNHEVTSKKLALDKVARAEKPVQMMALSTPRGKDYHLTLADGTQVWLNADSRLEFPDHFSGDRREVRLKGEAYFEVAKDKLHPFIVHNDYFTTRVLGTAFNVKAYSLRDAAVTLVEGKVQVSAGSELMQLRPGQQAWMQQSQLHMREVDTYPYIQWKEGFLYYENATLLTIMQDLARWYNVNVSFDDTSQMHLRLHFVVERDKPLAEAIKNLNSLGEVHATIEGNVVAIN